MQNYNIGAGFQGEKRLAAPGSAGVPPASSAGELSSEDFRVLFVAVCRALAFDALRMKPREKQFALLLASESFGEGSAHGAIDIEAWRLRLPEWRSNELKKMFQDWRRAGWIVVDVTENAYRLAPDQLPGWANVQAIQKSEQRVRPLNLLTEDDLHKTFAKISQEAALAAAKISQPREPTEGNVPTFNRLTSERLNVQRSPAACEKFAVARKVPVEPPAAVGQTGRSAIPAGDQVETLRSGVRQFVGEADWTSKAFWNCGLGWRARLFVEEYAQLEGALSYCKAALAEKGSPITVRKTRGAMLWDEFQRLRREAVR